MCVRRLFALAVVGLVACNSDSSTGVGAEVVGNWQLQALGGSQLPITCVPTNCPAHSQVGSFGLRVDVLGSAISASAGGSWTETLELRIVTVTGTVQQARTIRGTYVRAGDTVLFDSAGGQAYMTCAIGTLGLVCDDGRARYARQ